MSENVTTHVQTKIHFPKYMNETVMVASSMKVDFNLAALRVNLDNLFNGNKVLGTFRSIQNCLIKNTCYIFNILYCLISAGRTVNQFLNQNALEVVDDLKENIGESLSSIFKKIMNDAFSHIPTKLWLQDD